MNCTPISPSLSLTVAFIRLWNYFWLFTFFFLALMSEPIIFIKTVPPKPNNKVRQLCKVVNNEELSKDKKASLAVTTFGNLIGFFYFSKSQFPSLLGKIYLLLVNINLYLIGLQRLNYFMITSKYYMLAATNIELMLIEWQLGSSLAMLIFFLFKNSLTFCQYNA